MTRNDFHVLWLQAGSCGGCTMSGLSAEDRGLVDALAPFGIRFLWHPALSEASGRAVIDLLGDIEAGRQPLDALCIEGSAMRGPNGTGAFQMVSGTDRSMAHWIEALASKARYCVAVGSCSSFGGIPAAAEAMTDAVGLQFESDRSGGLLGERYRSTEGLPVINLSGCAPHPGWVVETLTALALGGVGPGDLDDFNRPKFYTDHLAHHGCSRNEFYEFKASAEKLSDRGCLMEFLGCKGTQAAGDCNMRVWNGTTGACTEAGFPCINCTAPGFEEPGSAYQTTPNIAGIPVGLPTDMPKAWFVALAALSKSATPKRVRENATHDHVVVPPVRRPRKP